MGGERKGVGQGKRLQSIQHPHPKHIQQTIRGRTVQNFYSEPLASTTGHAYMGFPGTDTAALPQRRQASANDGGI
jgi:hypothetical protein